MDISEYWKSIKKQSKSISGVKRVGDGLFNKSGIGPSLEKYTKAVKAGKSDKIKKEANAALIKVRVYLKTIHAKEMQNKKEYSPAQLKSMSIIGTACEKINIQLRDVLFDSAKAGSFAGDAGKDAKKSGDDFIEPKLKKAADEHLDLRKRAVPASAKLLKKYQSQAAKAPNYLKIGKKGADQAVASKRAGNTSDNMRGIDLADRAVEEIEGILDIVSKDYDKNVNGHNSNLMAARQDFNKQNTLPEPHRTAYKKKSGEYFRAMDKNVAAINDVLKNLRGTHAEAESYLDVAEANSMEAVDPAKLIKKVKAIHVAAEKTKKDLELASSRIQDAGNKAMDVANSSLDLETKKKAIKTRIEFFNKNYVRAKGLAKQEKALKGRLSTIGANVEDRGVLDAIGEVDGIFKEALSWVQEIGKVGPASKRKMDQAVAQIKAEGARAA